MSKNKIPFLHETSLRILREEREALMDGLGAIKRQINHMQFLRMHEPDDFEYFSWESTYGGNVSKLTKRRNQWLKDLKDVEASIALLKVDGQRDHEEKFQLAQAAERFKKEGSYNCLGGC